MCLHLEVQLVDNRLLNKASVTTTRRSTSGNKSLNKASVSTTRRLTSGQQTP